MIGPTDLIHSSPAPHFKTFHVFFLLVNNQQYRIKNIQQLHSNVEELTYFSHNDWFWLFLPAKAFCADLAVMQTNAVVQLDDE